MRMLPSWLLLSSITLLTLAAPARADDAADQAEGRILFSQGLELYRAEKYAQACPKFEASLRRFPGLGTRGKLAQCYEKIGRTASAWGLYREVAVIAKRRGETRRETAALAAAEALKPRLAYLIVEVGAAARVEGLEVRIGDRILEAAIYGTPTPRDPGTRSVEASAPGYETSHQEVVIDPEKTVTIDIGALKALPEPPPSAQAASAGQPNAANERRAWQLPLGLVTTGAGAASLIASGIFAAVASSTWDSAFEGGCDTGSLRCDQSGFDKSEDARTQANVSTAMFVTGAVLTAAGVTLWLTTPAAGEGADVALGVAVTPSGMRLEGRF